MCENCEVSRGETVKCRRIHIEKPC